MFSLTTDDIADCDYHTMRQLDKFGLITKKYVAELLSRGYEMLHNDVEKIQNSDVEIWLFVQFKRLLITTQLARLGKLPKHVVDEIDSLR